MILYLKAKTNLSDLSIDFIEALYIIKEYV